MSNDICKYCKSAVMGRMANSENNPYYSGDVCYSCAKAELVGFEKAQAKVQSLQSELEALKAQVEAQRIIIKHLDDGDLLEPQAQSVEPQEPTAKEMLEEAKDFLKKDMLKGASANSLFLYLEQWLQKKGKE